MERATVFATRLAVMPGPAMIEGTRSVASAESSRACLRHVRRRLSLIGRDERQRVRLIAASSAGAAGSARDRTNAISPSQWARKRPSSIRLGSCRRVWIVVVHPQKLEGVVDGSPVQPATPRVGRRIGKRSHPAAVVSARDMVVVQSIFRGPPTEASIERASDTKAAVR